MYLTSISTYTNDKWQQEIDKAVKFGEAINSPSPTSLRRPIDYAAEAGNLAAVKYLIQLGASITFHPSAPKTTNLFYWILNVRDVKKRVALLEWLLEDKRYEVLKCSVTEEHILAALGRIDIDELYAKRDTLKADGATSLTALHCYFASGIAISDPDLRTLTSTLNLNYGGPDHFPIGHLLVAKQQFEILEKLIINNSINLSLNETLDKTLISIDGYCYEDTPTIAFFLADLEQWHILRMSLEKIKDLSTYDIDLQFKTEDGATLPLICAVFNKWDLLKLLVKTKQGSNIDLMAITNTSISNESAYLYQYIANSGDAELKELCKDKIKLAQKKAAQKTKSVAQNNNNHSPSTAMKIEIDENTIERMNKAMTDDNYPDLTTEIIFFSNRGESIQHLLNQELHNKAARYGAVSIIEKLSTNWGLKLHDLESTDQTNLLFWSLFAPPEKRKKLLEWLLNEKQFLQLGQGITKEHIKAALGEYSFNNQANDTPDSVGLKPYDYALLSGIDFIKNKSLRKKILEACHFGPIMSSGFLANKTYPALLVAANKIPVLEELMKIHKGFTCDLNEKIFLKFDLDNHPHSKNQYTLFLHLFCLNQVTLLLKLLKIQKREKKIDLNEIVPFAVPNTLMFYMLGGNLRLFECVGTFNNEAEILETKKKKKLQLENKVNQSIQNISDTTHLISNKIDELSISIDLMLECKLEDLDINKFIETQQVLMSLKQHMEKNKKDIPQAPKLNQTLQKMIDKVNITISMLDSSSQFNLEDNLRKKIATISAAMSNEPHALEGLLAIYPNLLTAQDPQKNLIEENTPDAIKLSALCLSKAGCTLLQNILVEEPRLAENIILTQRISVKADTVKSQLEQNDKVLLKKIELLQLIYKVLQTKIAISQLNISFTVKDSTDFKHARVQIVFKNDNAKEMQLFNSTLGKLCSNPKPTLSAKTECRFENIKLTVLEEDLFKKPQSVKAIADLVNKFASQVSNDNSKTAKTKLEPTQPPKQTNPQSDEEEILSNDILNDFLEAALSDYLEQIAADTLKAEKIDINADAWKKVIHAGFCYAQEVEIVSQKHTIVVNIHSETNWRIHDFKNDGKDKTSHKVISEYEITDENFIREEVIRRIITILGAEAEIKVESPKKLLITPKLISPTVEPATLNEAALKPMTEKCKFIKKIILKKEDENNNNSKPVYIYTPGPHEAIKEVLTLNDIKFLFQQVTNTKHEFNFLTSIKDKKKEKEILKKKDQAKKKQSKQKKANPKTEKNDNDNKKSYDKWEITFPYKGTMAFNQCDSVAYFESIASALNLICDGFMTVYPTTETLKQLPDQDVMITITIHSAKYSYEYILKNIETAQQLYQAPIAYPLPDKNTPAVQLPQKDAEQNNNNNDVEATSPLPTVLSVQLDENAIHRTVYRLKDSINILNEHLTEIKQLTAQLQISHNKNAAYTYLLHLQSLLILLKGKDKKSIAYGVFKAWRDTIRHSYLDPTFNPVNICPLMQPIIDAITQIQQVCIPYATSYSRIFAPNTNDGLKEVVAKLQDFAVDLAKKNVGAHTNKKAKAEEIKQSEILAIQNDASLDDITKKKIILLLCSFVGEAESDENKARNKDKSQPKGRKKKTSVYLKIFKALGHDDGLFNADFNSFILGLYNTHEQALNQKHPQPQLCASHNPKNVS